MLARHVFLGAAALSVLALAAPLAAQSEETSGETAQRAYADEILVTARKRMESILKVPVVETVVTQETLERNQITSMGGLEMLVPGLVMGDAVLAIGTQISIRGVGTSTLDAGVDQSVSLNLDGLVLTQGLAYGAAFFDVAQVEVLKGPQALFYGKNSPGGVVAVRTADPGPEAEIIARFGYETEAQEKRSELILSTPVGDVMGIRLAGMFSDMEGFFRNRATAAPGFGGVDPANKKIDNKRSYILRGTMLLNPSDKFDARLKVNYVEDDIDGNAGMSQLSNCPDGTGAVPGFDIPFFHPDDNCKLDRDFFLVDLDPAAFPAATNNGVPFFNLQQKFGTLELNYRPDDETTLTSVTGFYRADLKAMNTGVQTGYAGPTLFAMNDFSREDFTQEFRLDTDFTRPFNFTLGAFYQDASVSNQITIGGNTALGLPALLGKGGHLIKIKTYSVFGQMRWQPVEKLEIAGGVRWTDEVRRNVAFTPVPRIKSENLSPELTVTYTPTDDLTLFGSLKQGYKSGSFTITTPANNPPFDDEKVQGGELGLKSRFFDRALLLNIAGFYYKYSGLQVGATDPAHDGLPVIRTINAGGAEVYGAELDLSFRPYSVPGLSFTGAISWNHARFTELSNVPCYGGQTIANGCNLDAVPADAFALANGYYVDDPVTGAPIRYTTQDLSGSRLVRAPDWQVLAGVDYEMPLSNAVSLGFGANGNYTSEYPVALSPRRDIVQGASFTMDANVRLTGKDKGWELALIANNLTNEIAKSRCDLYNYANGQIFPGLATGSNSVGVAGIDEAICTPKRGREVWLRLTIRPMALLN